MSKLLTSINENIRESLRDPLRSWGEDIKFFLRHRWAKVLSSLFFSSVMIGLSSLMSSDNAASRSTLKRNIPDQEKMVQEQLETSFYPLPAGSPPPSLTDQEDADIFAEPSSWQSLFVPRRHQRHSCDRHCLVLSGNTFMWKTKELSCGDTEASSHGGRKEGKRGEEGGSRRETKPTKTLKTQMIEKSEQRGGRRETQPRKCQKQTC